MEEHIAQQYERVKKGEISYGSFCFDADVKFIHFMKKFPEIDKKKEMAYILPILRKPN